MPAFEHADPLASCGDAVCTMAISMECKEVGVKEKSGTTFSTLTHILTAMVGAGVLAMPQAVGYLGWIAGPASIILFYLVSVVAAECLASVFEVNGVQHPRYFEACRNILGRKSEMVAKVCQLTNIFLVNIAYVITASISMTHIATLTCGSSGGSCFNNQWTMSTIFGGVQLLLAQLPNLEESAWVSVMGAVTALTYSTIALGLSIGKVVQGNRQGSIGGIPGSSAEKAFNVLNALGSIGFAFSFSQVLLEIQDTIREPPESKHTMKKAARLGLSLGVLYYLAVSTFGYLAFGSAAPSDILEAFQNPKWLVILAHVLVILHMLAAYNVFAQTFFLTFEGAMGRLFGMRHPAEEAALQAAAAVIAAQRLAEEIEEGSAKGDSGTVLDRPNSAIMIPKAVISVTAQRRGGAWAGAGPSGHGIGVTRQHSGPAGSVHSGALSGAPSGDLHTLHSAVFVRNEGADLGKDTGHKHSATLSAASTPRRSLPLETHDPVVHLVADDALGIVHDPRSPSLIHAHASFGDQRVYGVGGPYRMSGRGDGALHGAPGHPRRWRFLLFTTAVRCFYVCITTFLAVILPFFSEMTGLIGSATFFPLTIYFPFKMYVKVYKPPRSKVHAMYAVMVLMFLVAAGATLASIRNIIVSPFDSIF